MGHLTEIVILNDAMDEFRKHPKEFAEAIFEGIDKANMENKQVSVPFFGYCNYINVERSRHADHEVIFLHAGNGMTAIGAYEKDWEDLASIFSGEKSDTGELTENFRKTDSLNTGEVWKKLKEMKFYF